MNKNISKINEILDDNILTKIQFVKTNGTLKMVSKKIVVKSNLDVSEQRPLFPISKERK